MEKIDYLVRDLLFYFAYPKFYDVDMEQMIRKTPESLLSLEDKENIKKYIRYKNEYSDFLSKSGIKTSPSAFDTRSNDGTTGELIIDFEEVLKTYGIEFDFTKDFFKVIKKEKIVKKSGLAGLFGKTTSLIEYEFEKQPLIVQLSEAIENVLPKDNCSLWNVSFKVIEKDRYVPTHKQSVISSYCISPNVKSDGTIDLGNIDRKVAVFKYSFKDYSTVRTNIPQFLKDKYGIEIIEGFFYSC